MLNIETCPICNVWINSEEAHLKTEMEVVHNKCLIKIIKDGQTPDHEDLIQRCLNTDEIFQINKSLSDNKNYFGYAHTLPDIPSKLLCLLQQMEDGIDDSEVWDLRESVASYMYPRLQKFISCASGYPNEFTNLEDWKKTLEKIAYSIKLYADGEAELCKDPRRFREGTYLFAKHFNDLWD